MSVSSYQRLCHAGREDDMLTVDTLTLEQCVSLTGWKPELCLSIPVHADQLALQLSQARAAVANRITTGEITSADVERVL
jgi:hypothetical protein